MLLTQYLYFSIDFDITNKDTRKCTVRSKKYEHSFLQKSHISFNLVVLDLCVAWYLRSWTRKARNNFYLDVDKSYANCFKRLVIPEKY